MGIVSDIDIVAQYVSCSRAGFRLSWTWARSSSPNTGVCLVASWTLVRYANIRHGSFRSQLLSSSTAAILNMRAPQRARVWVVWLRQTRGGGGGGGASLTILHVDTSGLIRLI